MGRKLMGKKCGMVRVFNEQGMPVVCTLIKVEPNIVVQIKQKETDGYNAIQLGSDKIVVNDMRTIEKRVTKPRRGHFARANIAPRRNLFEIRQESVDEYELGQLLDVSIFEKGQYIDISGKTKGKGFQGVMKKYGFAGGPASHGSGFHRHAGSTGMRSDPGRCLPGGPRPSHMGNVQQTVQNLQIVQIDIEKGLMLVTGSVPGAKNSVVIISEAKKK